LGALPEVLSLTTELRRHSLLRLLLNSFSHTDSSPPTTPCLRPRLFLRLVLLFSRRPCPVRALLLIPRAMGVILPFFTSAVSSAPLFFFLLHYSSLPTSRTLRTFQPTARFSPPHFFSGGGLFSSAGFGVMVVFLIAPVRFLPPSYVLRVLLPAVWESPS